MFSNIFTSFCHTVLLVNNNPILFLGNLFFFILCSPPVFCRQLKFSSPTFFNCYRFSPITGLLFRSLNLLLLLLGKQEEGTPKVVQDGGIPRWRDCCRVGAGGSSMPLYPKRCYNFGLFAGDPLKSCFTDLVLVIDFQSGRRNINLILKRGISISC